MQEVRIQLAVKQKAFGQEEETRAVYRGKGTSKESGWFVTYREELEGIGTVNTVVRLGEDEAVLIRQGTLQMNQRFVRGETSRCWYVTPFARMEMETHTRRLQIGWEEGRPVQLTIAYQLWLNGQYAGEVELELQFVWL